LTEKEEIKHNPCKRLKNDLLHAFQFESLAEKNLKSYYISIDVVIKIVVI